MRRRISAILCMALVLNMFPMQVAAVGNVNEGSAVTVAAEETVIPTSIPTAEPTDTPVVTPMEELAVAATSETTSRLDALIGHMETAMKYGRNVEGAKYPNLFADGVNVDTWEPTKWNKGSNRETVQSNPYAQSNLLKALDGMTLLTGDPKYSEVAIDQYRTRFDSTDLVDDSGLLYAGGHSLVDVMTGEYRGLAYHEVKDNQLPYELMFKADPEGTIRFITALWNAHVYDWSSLIMNRHGYWDVPVTTAWDTAYTNDDPWVEADTCPFLCTADDLMEAAWFLTDKTGDPKYGVWAERMLDKYIGVRHPETKLLGGQYGTMGKDTTYGGDRLLYSVIGADFTTNSGFNYKNATMEDYKIAGANYLIQRTSTKSTTAYGAEDLAEVYRNTGNEKVYEFVRDNLVAWARYIYDQDKHLYKTPILADGTDLNAGGNSPKLIAQKTGYYISEGNAFPENEGYWGGILSGAVDACSILKPEDADAYEEIWTAARAFARNIGLGDIGTSMGQNLNLKKNNTATAPQYIQAVVKMYKYTGNHEYLEMACNMADKVVQNHYDSELGMFRTNKNSAYAAWDTESMYAVFMVEAAAQGYVNQINLDLSHGGTDVPHEGRGQIDTSTLWYNKTKVPVTSVTVSKDHFTMTEQGKDVTGCSDLGSAEELSGIYRMASLGVMGAESDGKFHPEKILTRREALEAVAALFGLSDYEDLVDANVNVSGSAADQQVNRLEVASMIVRALQNHTENTWTTSTVFYRIADASAIPAWAKDYVDIAANYRLMMDLEDTLFAPNTVVTKDMMAGILAEVTRYMEMPEMQKVNAAVVPYDADSNKLYYESLDPSIAEVDELGRLYPVSTGTTTVRVNSDGRYTDVEVSVVAYEDWMIKVLYIDGVSFEHFNSGTMNYTINLNKGVTTVPTITAESYSGEQVVVELPDSLPGEAKIYVNGAAEKYTLQINNDFVDYIIDEDFNRGLDVPLESITTDRFKWFINGTTIAYKDRWVTVSKNWNDPEDITDTCMVFPYAHEKNLDGVVYMTLDENDTQLTGENADDMLMIFEMDLAVKDMENKKNGYDLWFLEKFGNTYLSAAHFQITPDGIAREVQNYSPDRLHRRQLPDREFVNFKMVIDKKNKVFHYYLDGELVDKDVAFYHSATPNIHAMYVRTRMEDEACDAALYMDNLKVYQLTHAAFEDMMSQTEAPTPTPNPQWLVTAIDEDYDDFGAGVSFQRTAKDPYNTNMNIGQYRENGVVAAKSKVVSTASVTDKCLELQYNPSASTGGEYKYDLFPAAKQVLGTGAENKNVVIEMDVAVGGEDSKASGYMLTIGTTASYARIAKFFITDKEIGRVTNTNDTWVDPTLRTAIHKNQFYHLKVVVNKQTRNYSYYVDGVLIERGLTALYNSQPDISSIKFTVNKEEGQVDSQLYVDNLKMYVENVKAQPTPRPTNVPVPTATPEPTPSPTPVVAHHAIYEDFDRFEENTLAHTMSGYYWTAKWGLSYHHSRAYAVPKKATMDSNATASDMCLEFNPVPSGDPKHYNLPLYMNIEEDKQFVLGSEATGDAYLVVEMDVALTGQRMTDPIAIRMGGIENFGLTNFKLYNDYIVRHTDSVGMTTPTEKNVYTHGEVGHLKWVMDRTTKKYTWYWNGQLIESWVKAQFYEDSQTPALKYISISVPPITLEEGAEASDGRFYVDNVQVYTIPDYSVPAPTAIPTATPEPTPTPTPAPTQGPTPTPRPTATPMPTPGPTRTPCVAEPIMFEDFNEFDNGKHAYTLSGEDWTANWSLSYHHSRATVVDTKGTMSTTAGNGDKCLEFVPVTSAMDKFYGLPFRFVIAEEKQFPLGGEIEGDAYLVVEMDMAITGKDATDVSVSLRMGGNANYGLANFKLFSNYMARYIDSTYLTSASSKNAYTPGQVAHIKWIMDRDTKKYTWYWNGVMVESEVKAHFTGDEQTPALKYIGFTVNPITLAEGQETVDTKVYIDNVMVYTTDDNEMPSPTAKPLPGTVPSPTVAPTTTPTAAPTAAPTATPAPTAEPTAAPTATPGVESAYAAVLDKPVIQVSNEEQTVVMTIKAKSPVTVDGIGFTTKWDSPLVLTAITGGEKIGAFNNAATNLNNGIAGWSSPDAENVEGVTDLAVITFTVPANTAAGTYNVGVTALELTKDYGEIWERKATASTTLVIESAAPTPAPTPTAAPTAEPTATPLPTPTPAPTAEPTATPLPTPTPAPTTEPMATPAPTAEPTATPLPTPTPAPTAEPTATPLPTPTPAPTAEPTATPAPTSVPTLAPTAEPTPTVEPVLPPDMPHVHVPNEKGYCSDATCGQIVDGKAALYGRQLILNDSIGVNFYMDLTSSVNKNELTMKFTLANGKTLEKSFADVIVKNMNGKPYYGFMCEVFATEMNQQITAQLYEGDTAIGQAYVYSVKQYCDTQLQNEAILASPKTVNMIQSMMNYGAMSQIYFGNTAEGLVTTNTPTPFTSAELEYLQTNYAKKAYTQNARDQIAVRGMSLVLRTETALRAEFTMGAKSETENYSLSEFDFAAYHVVDETTLLEVEGRSGNYQGVDFFEIVGINPAELSNNYRIIVTRKADAAVVTEINYSPFTYLNSMYNNAAATQKLKDVIVSMYRYNEAAKAYQGN